MNDVGLLHVERQLRSPRRPRAPRSAMALVFILGASSAVAQSGHGVHNDPERSHGGYDIWVARALGDGTFEVPVNLGPNINTTRRETTPVVSWDGKRLFFASRNRGDGAGGEDIYVSAWQEDAWGPAVNLGPGVNTVLSELGPCLLPDGVTLVFSRKDDEQKAYDFALTAEVEGEWLDALPMGPPLHTPGDERLASVTADGSELYFAAARQSGYGSFDLYVSYKDDAGNWSDEQNLGSIINSAESDYSPGISPDGNRLYFSSQRDELGNFDIYVAERGEGGRWSEPVPLPAPINTRFTEYCPSIGPDGSLYFASDRRRGSLEPVIDEE